MRLLLLSNSRGSDGTYLQWARQWMGEFLGSGQSAVFIPYAAVPAARENLDAYAARVREAFAPMSCEVGSLHETEDPVAAVRSAQAIIVGGGNTFQLLAHSYSTGLLDTIRERVRAGIPYLGWSAGANLACPGIWTTNDMPIVGTPSLESLGLIPFQINPHFTDAHPPGHQGETRSERIAEFLSLNPRRSVVGLREGALLRIEQGRTWLHGTGARIFQAGREAREEVDGAELSLTS